MKKLIFSLIFAISISFLFFSLSSCNNSEIIGKFHVIKKEKTGFTINQGMVTLENLYNDTIKVFIISEAEFLNIKVGDIYEILKSDHGLSLKNNINRLEVGYSKILEKKIDSRIPRCKVLTRGQDTIWVDKVSEISYFNSQIGDSIYVEITDRRKNREGKEPHFYVE